MIDERASEEDIEWTPPSPERVANRALVLCAVVCRTGSESDAGNSEAESFRLEIVRWLDRLALVGEVEPAEIDLINKPLGALERKEKINASWRAEGLAVLSWALGKYELPPYDELSDAPSAGEAIGFLQDRIDTVVVRAHLRSQDQISALAESLFSAHWRLREYSLRPEAMNFEEFARTASFGPLSLEGLRLSGRDLAITARPLS